MLRVAIEHDDEYWRLLVVKLLTSYPEMMRPEVIGSKRAEPWVINRVRFSRKL